MIASITEKLSEFCIHADGPSIKKKKNKPKKDMDGSSEDRFR